MDAKAGPASHFRLGEFTLDPQDERVWGPAGHVKLGNKAFQVLMRLVEQDGGLVTKDELFSSVWDGMAVSESALTSAAVLLILGAARAFAWILIIEGIPQMLAETIIAWDLSPVAFLLAVNVLLLAFGLFMDPLPGVMILVPILAPISFALGIDPDHFAIIVIVNLTLGLTTPPVGSLIFVVSSAVALKPTQLVREMPPFFAALAIALLLITFVPALSTWLPAVSGF